MDHSLLGAGQSVRFTVDRNGDKRQIVVTQSAIKAGDYLLGLIKRTSVTLFVLTAAVLLLLRPSSMLWGFFLFAIGSIHGSPLILDAMNPAVGAVVDGRSLLPPYYMGGKKAGKGEQNSPPV